MTLDTELAKINRELATTIFRKETVLLANRLATRVTSLRSEADDIEYIAAALLRGAAEHEAAMADDTKGD